jgi:hypothetical protein
MMVFRCLLPFDRRRPGRSFCSQTLCAITCFVPALSTFGLSPELSARACQHLCKSLFMALSNQCVYPFDASIPSPYTKDYLAFILEFHTFDVLGMLAEPNDTRHFSLPIDFCILLDSNCELAHLTLAFPEHLFPLFDEALLQSQQQIYAASAEKSKLRVKPLCHARLFNLHLGSETTKPNISSIRSTDGPFIPQRLIRTMLSCKSPVNFFFFFSWSIYQFVRYADSNWCRQNARGRA